MLDALQVSNCVTVPNFLKIGQTPAEILRFFYFSTWRPPPSRIFKISNFQRPYGSRGSKCVAVPILVEIGQTAAAIWRFFDFNSMPQCLHCKRCTSYSNSVCLSVCPSVTCRYCVKTTARSKVQFPPLDSKMCLVL